MPAICRLPLILIAALFFGAAPLRAQEFKIETGNCKTEAAYAREVRSKISDLTLQAFHDILMDNELKGGCGSLQLIDARMDSKKNGFSFGLSQFDLATRKGSLSVLKDIVRCASKEFGAPLLTKDDVKFLDQHARKATAVLKADKVLWARFRKLREPIEKALGSECGRAQIGQTYLRELQTKGMEADTYWNAVLRNNPNMKPAEKFFRLYVLDLLNVTDPPEGFLKAVSDPAARPCFGLCQAGIVAKYKLDGPVTVTDLIRYPLQLTCYGFVPQVTRQQDVIRRLNRVMMAIDFDALPLTDKDKAFLTGSFADIVETNKSNFVEAEDSRLRMLITAANGGKPIKGKIINLDGATLKLAEATCRKK